MAKLLLRCMQQRCLLCTQSNSCVTPGIDFLYYDGARCAVEVEPIEPPTEKSARRVRPRRATHRADVSGADSIYGRGTLRRFDLAIRTASPTPPLSTTLLIASANPLICSPVMVGGTDSAIGSVIS